MEGTDMGHENAEGMAHVGVRLTDQFGACAWRSGTVCRQRAAARGESLVATTGTVMAGQTLAMLPFLHVAPAMR